jgi:hydroxymethylbilane synthase
MHKELTSSVNRCDTLGKELADAMISDGALDILAKAEEIAFKDEMPERL